MVNILYITITGVMSILILCDLFSRVWVHCLNFCPMGIKRLYLSINKVAYTTCTSSGPHVSHGYPISNLS